jgi:hypothetical protein
MGYRTRLVLILLGTFAISANAEARPISYKGGWMLMQEHDFSETKADAMYTFTGKDAVGIGYVNSHNDEFEGYFAHYNRLLQRWNFPDAQASIFLLTGVGVVDEGSDQNLAGSVGIEADAENRRFYTAYQNEYMKGGDIVDEFTQKFRVGVAPYIGDYEDLHTWLILEVKHQPQEEDNVVLQPMVRMFKGNYLWETGVSEHGDVLFNFRATF